MIWHNKLGKKPAEKLCSSIPSPEVDMITAGFCTPPVNSPPTGGVLLSKEAKDNNT